MKVFAITLLVIIGLSFSFGEIVPNFPGNQPLVIDGSTPTTSNQTNTSTEVKTIVDNFVVNEPTITITVPSGGAPPSITKTQFSQVSGVIGGERDVIFTALSASAGKVFSADVSQGTFSVAAPTGGSGTAELQYDGIDSSATLSTNPGLGGIDMTADGSYGFQVGAVSDLATTFTISVYSGNGASASSVQSVPGTKGSTVPTNYQIAFSKFTGVDFTNVVAIQVMIDIPDNVDFILSSISTYGSPSIVSEGGSNVTGSVLPCNADYYRIKTLSSLVAGNYMRIHFNQSGESSHPNDLGSFYIVASKYTNLQSELISNLNIVDTLGQLPGPDNYLYACEQVSECDIEVTCQLEELTYYVAVVGGDQGYVNYNFEIYLRQAPVYELLDCVPQPVIEDRRPTQGYDDHTLYYRFFAIDIPESSYSEGTYLVVNISRVESSQPLELRLAYAGLPGSTSNTGVWNSVDYDSAGALVDDCTFNYCVDTTGSSFVHPVNTDSRIACVSTTSEVLIGDGPTFQYSTKLTVDPCQFQYGVWYAAILLPVRSNPTDSQDTTGYANYTITACVVQPTITELERNITLKGYVEPELQTNYKFVIPEDEIVDGETHLFIQVSNVRNGFVDIWVHNEVGVNNNLAGGPEGCLPANATCHTCDACNIIIEKCHFTPGTWYISVSIGMDSEGVFEIVDYDRLPITYTIRADFMEDPKPITLLSGVPVSRAIGAGLYDFFVVDIPPTVDTWLFIELYTKACDTEVIISVLHGSLPGGECYERPDFYCLTGDPQETTFTTPLAGTFVSELPKTRESCTFMIQTCELEAGPLYISVYGQRTNYAAYGDTTYYQIPAHYTLFVDFDVAMSLTSGISYSETVYQDQYQHYYIRADQILEGSFMTVEVTNIQHGIPQSVEIYINYNYLAGDCPCYESLYNATGAYLPSCNNVPPSNEPNWVLDPDSVWTCATIVVSPCDFRPGVWYVGIKGVNQDLAQYTTPIGYTLTVTVHDAPVFNPLILGQSTPSTVAQYNKTLEYTHFKLAASPLPLSDLVFKLTYVQNPDYLGKHDNIRDVLTMYVNSDGPAGDNCYDYYCEADIENFSYCTVVIPSCEWQSVDYFVAVQGNYHADFIGRFTIRAYLEEVRTYELTSGVSVYDRVAESLYKHYFITTTGEVSKYLSVDFYTNNDQDNVNVYLNVHELAGDTPCFRNIDSCVGVNSCSFQVETCDIEQGRYYISVYGVPHQFYDISTEYTLTAALKTLTTALGDGNPFTGSIKAGGVLHYQIQVDTVSTGDFLLFEIDNVQHGSLAVYYQYESVAGRCPCYIFEQICYADSEGTDWCEIRVPSCEFQAGRHFFSVVGLVNESPSALTCNTDIGYTIEVNVIKPNIINPTFVVGRDTTNTELFQFIANGRYNHYQLDFTEQDYQDGYHIIVEITAVRDGALFVYFTPDAPGDENTACHLAKICTSGLGSGKSCYWQIPFSLTKPRWNKSTGSYDTTLFVTVEGRTGRLQASYSILIYKEAVPEIIENPLFTLDNQVSSFYFPTGVELNVTHNKVDEPNGWTQFIKLANVSAPGDALNGEMLEVFFYRITNNINEPMAFNVYLFPNRPAGAHECCGTSDSNLGSCQGAPTLTTVDLTTNVLSSGNSEVYSHTCNLPVGSGSGPTSSPFYGERCTVQVWPCKYNRYDCTSVSDWWLAVVPIAPTDASSTPLTGLQYSVQFRVRDIRLDENFQINSIPLIQYVNTYDYTPAYIVKSITTEDQGWLSFVLDLSSNFFSGRLSIQTSFINGTSEVYITPNKFASPPVNCSGECAQYYCASNAAGSSCDSTGRFLATTCNLQPIYYITVRNIGAASSTSAVKFRIVAIYDEPSIQIPYHTVASSPFVATSNVSNINNIYGLQGEDYDFYTLTIDDTDINDHQSLIIELARTLSGDTGVLDLFFRLGSRAGEYTGENQSFYTSAETCYGWDYKCSNVGAQETCILQIPHTQLIRGHYSISVYNPNFDFTTPTDLPQYTLTVFMQDSPTDITLDVPYVVSSPSSTYTLPGTYVQYRVNVTESDILYNTTGYENYYTKYLRFQLTGIASTSSINMYVNYDDLAGDDTNSVTFSLGSFDSVDCTSTGCYIDVLPCPSSAFKLKTGTYYIGLYVNAATTYNLTAMVVTETFTSVTPSAVNGTGERSGLVDYVWTITPTTTERANNGDGYGYYRYALNTADSGVTDLTFYYFYANITIESSNNTGVDSASVLVWRDDCAEFVCGTSLDEFCVIDALTLAPCSVRGGYYYIEIYAPTASLFTFTFHQDMVFVQTLVQAQTFVDEVYPYEYDEYFFSFEDVDEGATLAVQVCALCGEVEAWIRPDLPAGPGPDITGFVDSCGLDYCAASSNGDLYFNDDSDSNCCTLFLDTCQYEQRGYYIAIRGVGTTFPNSINQHLYLPAKYQVQAIQTNIQINDISFCPTVVEYVEIPSRVPQQFAVDVESANVGAMLRFSMVLPTQYVLPAGTAAILTISRNRTVGYTSACDNLPYTCSVAAGASQLYCYFDVPSCSALPGRYYIWADAPRGTEILVERWDPVIPMISTDVEYHATINGPSTVNGIYDSPFQPATQYYRFDYPLSTTDDDDDTFDNVYDKFYVKIRVQNVLHGSISVALNTGFAPYNSADSNCETPVFVNSDSCAVATDGYDCSIEIQLTDINYVFHQHYPRAPTTFWLTVTGTEQLCELHSIQYSFIVQTQWVVTYFDMDTTRCDSVDEGEYNFHRLRPHAMVLPQQYYLRFTISDIDAVFGDEVYLSIKDGYLPTLDTATYSYRSGREVPPSGSIDIDWYCSYDNLYFSLYGINSNNGYIDYRLNVSHVPVAVKELFNNNVYHADDDDDDACPHEHDFYIFRAIAPNTGYRTSFLRVAVESDGPVEVYVNKGGFAWEQCHVAYGQSTRGTLNVYDFCDYQDTIYYITVISDGPYYIFTNVIDSAINLTLGEVYRGSVAAGQYQMYTLDICEDWLRPDDRLVVEIADVQGANVYGWIQKDSNPGPYQYPSGQGVCDIVGTSAVASYGAGDSGYAYILVDHCELSAGTYHILIRADPRIEDDTDVADDDDRNLQDVSYRLFPYLKSYGITPVNLTVNVPMSGAVDYYTVDRFESGAVQMIDYYRVTPLFSGYNNAESFAQVRLSDVSGGLLRLRAQRDRLASPEYGYIPGSITGLTQDYALSGYIQSGHRPYTYQPILDPRTSAYDSCDGCTDFCDTMSVSDIQQYLTDKSVSITLSSCYWDLGSEFYIAVEAVEQFSEDIPISYTVEVDQYKDFTLLQPNINQVDSMTNDNWEYHYYRSIQAEVQSARWRVVVTDGEGVLVTVRNHRCPLQATWTREIWCDADYFDRPWMCDIEIPTAVSHPGDNVFFVSVYGKNATYSLAYWRGLENCHDFSNTGASEGLDFCAGLVPYTTWRWDDYSQLDDEARCFFNDLYNHFRVQPCWSGVTTDCNATLQRFACYESFRRCDEYGFYVGTCRKACNAVVYECVNMFESVNLEHYNCSSSRYIDEEAYTCTGSDDFATFTPGTANLFFPANPEEILYQTQSEVEMNAGVLPTLSFLIAIIAFLVL